MILKRLFEEYNIPIETIVFKEYKRLNLTKEEAWFLIALFKNVYQSGILTKTKLIEMSDFTEEKVNKFLKSLLKKGFFNLELQPDESGKERDIIILDPTFLKIEKLLKEDEKRSHLSENIKDIKKTINNLEELFNRNLSSLEVDLVKAWYGELNYEHDKIIKTIEKHKTKPNPSISKIEKDLEILDKEFKYEKMDAKKEEELMKIYRAIKK